ncbi:ribonuclease G [Butyrivibrio proteoclasticus]|uniref:Ribonuclease G n=1 Tax=Butyrivibrio proteoclasticus TaxID=43305 RepID=A0A1I5QP31_9FIRM|nr:ribonuclease E/G [Butyrivibrio proteoclasticus]SFP48003.1 ribonuclease G [Butyrivibrio proteoclasticus]
MAEIVISKYLDTPLVTAFIDNKLEFLEFIRQRELHNIYLGRVDHIVKNIDAAFVRYKDDEIGYLPLKSILPVCVINRKLGATDSVKAGDEVIVQVEVEKIKTKKPKLTTYLSLAGKYSVLTLGRKGVGASLKLDDKIRKTLIDDVKEDFNRLSFDSSEAFYDTSFGIIIRTNAADIDGDKNKAILDDASECIKLMSQILSLGMCRTNGSLLYSKEQSLYAENEDMTVPFIDKAKAFLKTRGITDPVIVNDTGIHGINSKVQELRSNKVWLKSGAYLIIEQLESFNAIDVNTGKAISGKKDISKKVNIEAAQEIMRQIRLRNLSGMILIDFINMKDDEDYHELIELVKRLARQDYIHTEFIDVTGLGIMELTRNKNDKSLKELLLDVEKAVDISKHQC